MSSCSISCSSAESAVRFRMASTSRVDSLKWNVGSTMRGESSLEIRGKTSNSYAKSLSLLQDCAWWYPLLSVQAVTFLVIHQKPNKSLEEITTDLCPVLSVQQLYRISTMYWDDKYNTETVSPEVLHQMKQLMVDNSSAASHSFLLDDDSSIPFQLEHIVANMEEKVRREKARSKTAKAHSVASEGSASSRVSTPSLYLTDIRPGSFSSLFSSDVTAESPDE